MSTISLKGVSKRFGAFEVIKGVDLDIKEGEFVILVGPSGCGKSTLLRMIAGLEDVSGGSIAISDREVHNLPPQKRNIAMVFQNYALYPHYSVAQNLGFGLRLRALPPDEIRTKVEEAARMLGLEDLLDRYPRQLSGGQRQRVAMGRAIVRDPDVYLFDEPLSNLDAKLRIAMRSEIKTLHQRVGRTTVYVTHDQVEAMTMADRIVILRNGLVAQQGSPMELYGHPCNRFVAGFIGTPTMNFLDGNIRLNGDASRFILADGESLPIDFPPLPQGPAVVGIRPDDIHIVPDSAEGGMLSGRIALVEPTGPSDYLHIETASGTLTAIAPNGTGHVGDAVALSAAPQDWHLFGPGEDGRRLVD